MPEAIPQPRWKRALSLSIKIYCGFCTVLLSNYLIAIIWTSFTATPFDTDKFYVQTGYDSYMAKEYPKKGTYFQMLATTLGQYGKRELLRAGDGRVQELG